MNIRNGRGVSVIALPVLALKNQFLTLLFIIQILQVRIHNSHSDENRMKFLVIYDLQRT